LDEVSQLPDQRPCGALFVHPQVEQEPVAYAARELRVSLDPPLVALLELDAERDGLGSVFKQPLAGLAKGAVVVGMQVVGYQRARLQALEKHARLDLVTCRDDLERLVQHDASAASQLLGHLLLADEHPTLLAVTVQKPIEQGCR